MNQFKRFLLGIGEGFADLGAGIGGAVRGILRTAGQFLRDFFVAVIRGDIFTKLSLIIMGVGHVRRGKILYGILITAVEVLFLRFCTGFAATYLAKFNTLGTVKAEQYFDFELFTNVWNDYDHSFKILLYGILSIVVIAAFVFIWMNNVREAHRLELAAKNGEKKTTLQQDLYNVLDKNYHKTLLALPCTGIMVFTIIPLIVMICVAFTNYDQQHMPPTALFTWVGFENFKAMFSTELTLNFSYAFEKILSWTLTWAVLATFTCYVGGILLALLINNKRTMGKGLWRLCFVVAMAVPQFVSLLLVRNFFADAGIVNTVMSNWGVTEFLKNIGLVPEYLEYIPFLTNKNWAKFMILLINFWVGVPYLLLIATGVLMNIPQDLYEAATIDGAGPVQQFLKITMPYMLFVTGPYLINSVVQNINNFNVIYLLTQDIYETTDMAMAAAHARETDLLVHWLFRLTNEYYNYKMAAVIGILVFVVCTVITLLAFNVVIKGDKEESMQ